LDEQAIFSAIKGGRRNGGSTWKQSANPQIDYRDFLSTKAAAYFIIRRLV
jgi:hypothetical protein